MNLRLLFISYLICCVNIPSPIHREIYQNPLSMIKRDIAFLGKITKNKLYENEILDLLKF